MNDIRHKVIIRLNCIGNTYEHCFSALVLLNKGLWVVIHARCNLLEHASERARALDDQCLHDQRVNQDGSPKLQSSQVSMQDTI